MGAFMEWFGKDLAESGELVDTRGLTAGARPQDPPAGRRACGHRRAYPKSGEVLAGYWIVECESFDRATQIAARLTAIPGPGIIPK